MLKPGLFGLVVAAIFLGACSEEGDEPANVAVTLREWEIVAQPAEVKPGNVVFQVTNNGTREHQFIVVKSDLPPGQLPTFDNAVDEEKVNISGSINRLQPGESSSVEMELFPGKYVLICNLVDRSTSGPADPHYLNGMATSFLVLDE